MDGDDVAGRGRDVQRPVSASRQVRSWHCRSGGDRTVELAGECQIDVVPCPCPILVPHRDRGDHRGHGAIWVGQPLASGVLVDEYLLACGLCLCDRGGDEGVRSGRNRAQRRCCWHAGGGGRAAGSHGTSRRCRQADARQAQDRDRCDQGTVRTARRAHARLQGNADTHRGSRVGSGQTSRIVRPVRVAVNLQCSGNYPKASLLTSEFAEVR